MTLEELIAREHVRDTYARYNHAGDRGRLDDLASCFTEDGVLEVRNGFIATGRPEIVDNLRVIAKKLVRTDQPPAGLHHIARHYVTNLLFEEVTSQHIVTAAYFAVFVVDAADHWGRYRDVLVPGQGRWLFAHRKVSVDGRRPESGAT